jgi:hypothetical protein
MMSHHDEGPRPIIMTHHDPSQWCIVMLHHDAPRGLPTKHPNHIQNTKTPDDIKLMGAQIGSCEFVCACINRCRQSWLAMQCHVQMSPFQFCQKPHPQLRCRHPGVSSFFLFWGVLSRWLGSRSTHIMNALLHSDASPSTSVLLHNEQVRPVTQHRVGVPGSSFFIMSHRYSFWSSVSRRVIGASTGGSGQCAKDRTGIW